MKTVSLLTWTRENVHAYLRGHGYLKGDYRAYEDAKRALCRNCDPDKYEQRIRWICEYLDI